MDDQILDQNYHAIFEPPKVVYTRGSLEKSSNKETVTLIGHLFIYFTIYILIQYVLTFVNRRNNTVFQMHLNIVQSVITIILELLLIGIFLCLLRLFSARLANENTFVKYSIIFLRITVVFVFIYMEITLYWPLVKKLYSFKLRLDNSD